MTASTARRAVATSAMLGTAMVVAACGTATPGQGTGAGARASTSASASATAGTPTPSRSQSASTVAATCAPSQLKAMVDTSQSGAAAGSVYVPIDLTNVSATPCTLYGYPGVSFVTSPTGNQLGRAAIRNPAAKSATVMLAPGARAHATLQVAQAGNYEPSQCQPVTAHWLRIYPPDQFTPIYTRFTTQACSAKLPATVGTQLSIMVVRPGAGTAGQGP